MQTERSGDIILGPQCDARHDRHLVDKPAAIVVNEPSCDAPVVLGAYPTSSSLQDLHRFELPQRTHQLSGLTTYFSSAPLTNIERMSVFEDNESRFCRGILFEYTNGGSRAVGQCRLGVDRAREYNAVSSICSRTTKSSGVPSNVLIEIGTCSASCRPQEEWNCWDLSKVLYFWFSEQGTLLSVA